VQLLGEMEGSGYRRPPALVRRADGQTITLSPLLYLTLAAMDGRRGYGDIARAVSDATGRHVVPDDISYLTERKLRPLGLLTGTDGSQPRTSKVNPLLALRFKLVVTDTRWTRRLTAPFAGLFTPLLVVALVAGFAAFTWWLLVEKGFGSAVHQAFYEPGMILALWVLIAGSAAFHEFGHAAACRYGGATPGGMGVGLYLIWPAFYTEVTDSYRLGRAGRLRVDLGGLYFNAIFALLTLGAWAATQWDALLLVAAAQHLQMVRQLAPFIRADGYHIVADLTGVPDLFAHIKPTLQGLLPRRWRPAQPPALKRWARAIVVTWVFTMVPVLIGLIALGTMLLPRLAATAWDSMHVQWDAVGHYWSGGDMLGVAVRGLSSVIVLLPVVGLVYMLFRIGRRAALWAWRSSEDNPGARGAAALTGVAVLAAVAWAWWPSGQYEPVDADDDGTLSDLVRIEDRRIFLPLLESTVLMRPAVGTADVAPAAPVVPTTGTTQVGPGSTVSAADSAAAAGGGPGPASLEGLTAGDTDTLEQLAVAETVATVWPFPWQPPGAIGEVDNRAESVNTVDDSVVTDLAVSWAIVTAGEVDDRNEAWALASCEDCVTRAVAFQLLLLVGDLDVVTPVNSAVAANYECTRCTTEAIATQLVISLTGMPSPAAQQLIEDAMQRLKSLEADLDELSSGQVYYVLQATQAEIIAILENDGVIPDLTLTDAEDSLAVAADAGAPEPGSTSAGEPSATPTGEPSPTSEASATPTGEPSPTSEPTTAESSEPSPTATPTAGSEPSATEATPTAEPSTTETSPTAEPSPTP
jgi:putative peptide zinc metalloprotease protein